MGGRFIERFVFSAKESVDFSHLTTWKEKIEVEEEVEEMVQCVAEGQSVAGRQSTGELWPILTSKRATASWIHSGGD